MFNDCMSVHRVYMYDVYVKERSMSCLLFPKIQPVLRTGFYTGLWGLLIKVVLLGRSSRGPQLVLYLTVWEHVGIDCGYTFLHSRQGHLLSLSFVF